MLAQKIAHFTFKQFLVEDLALRRSRGCFGSSIEGRLFPKSLRPNIFFSPPMTDHPQPNVSESGRNSRFELIILADSDVRARPADGRNGREQRKPARDLILGPGRGIALPVGNTSTKNLRVTYLPAATAVFWPVAMSAGRMRRRSRPTARRTLLIGSRPPEPDWSAATALASWSASGADRLVIEVPNRMRDNSSSCGSCGTLAKVISGAGPSRRRSRSHPGLERSPRPVCRAADRAGFRRGSG